MLTFIEVFGSKQTGYGIFFVLSFLFVLILVQEIQYLPSVEFLFLIFAWFTVCHFSLPIPCRRLYIQISMPALVPSVGRI